MQSIIIRRISIHDPEYRDVWTLREEVLRKPLGQSLRNEDLSGEVAEYIIIATESGEVIGCVMLRPLTGGALKARQMAVAASQQGKGIGTKLMREAEMLAAAEGFGCIMLHARKTAVPFYERLGYAVEGGEFSEVGIPHLFMQKDIA